MRFERILEDTGRVSQVALWRKSISGRATNWSKDPNAGVCMVCSGNSKEAGVAGMESTKG